MRILAIDISNIFRRYWEACEGRDVAESFKRTVDRVARDRAGFDRVAICCDNKDSFRKAIEPGYKKDRQRLGENYHGQLDRTVRRLGADGCWVFVGVEMDMSEIGGPASGLFAEGDDVIASLVAWAVPLGHQVRILGADKDLLALVDDETGVDVDRLESGVWSAETVITKIGVAPTRIPDWLALGGDKSDGFKAFPGWEERSPDGKVVKRPGIAETGAAKLIQKFGSLIGVFDALDAKDEEDNPCIGGHVGEVLRRHGLAAGRKGLALATLQNKLPIDFSCLLQEGPIGQISSDAAPPPDDEPTDPAPAASPAAVERGGVSAVKGPTGGARPIELAEVSPEKPPTPRAEILLASDERFTLAPYSLEPKDGKGAWWLAGRIAEARIFPKFVSQEQIFTVILMGRARGVASITSLENAFTVHGQVGWKAAFIAGIVMASGKCEFLEIDVTDETRAIAITKRVKRPEKLIEFTIDQAKKLGYLDPPKPGKDYSSWHKQPAVMLRWRALTAAARTWFYDVVSGMYLPDELRPDGHATDEELLAA